MKANRLEWTCLSIVLLGTVAAAVLSFQIQGAEVYRRTLPANSVVRVYLGNTLASTTPAQGDTRITIGLSSTPLPPPTPVLDQLTVPAQIPASATATGGVRLSAPATSPTAVTLSSTSAQTVSVPPSVTVQTGATSALFTLTAGPSAGTATVSALRGTVTLTQAVQVVKTTPEPEPPEPEPAGGWYVAPNGTPTGAGTRSSPWDLDSTVSGARRATLAGGGTVWLLGGVYRIPPSQNREGLGYRCAVGGTSTNPLVFRAYSGSRVTIDGGWSFFGGSNYTWIRDLEVTVTDQQPGRPPYGESGSWPSGTPNGGVNFYTSTGCKAVNCVITNNRQGLSMWTEAKEAEGYGNLVFDNGWLGSDRAHGHGCYIQNPASTTKRVTDNIFTQNKTRSFADGRYELHGYGQSVAVTNVIAEGNFGAESRNAWLLDDGAVLGPSSGHHFNNNAIYGVRVRLGSRPDQPLEFKGNTISGEVQISTGPEVSASGNLIVPPNPRPTTDQVIVRPNRYEPGRANVMLIDWTRNGKVLLAASGVLEAGDLVRVMAPWDWYGTPLWAGQWPAAGVELPVDGARAVVIVKGGSPPASVLREEAPVSPRLKGSKGR